MEGIRSQFKRLLNKHKIVGFIGVVGSGKDHSADKWVFEHNFQRISFADPLRLLISMIFGKDVAYDKYNRFKITSIMVGIFWRQLSGREFIQKLGDGMRTIFGDDIFLDVMDRKIESINPESRGVVIPDVRYYNEAIYVLQLGGDLYFCNYQSDRYDCVSDHISEQLAQAFIAMGYETGDKIDSDALKTAKILMDEKNYALRTRGK
jgi:hypothetical protein